MSEPEMCEPEPDPRMSEPPRRCTRASFYSAKGVTDRCQRKRKGQKCKRGGSCNSAGTVALQCGTVLSYLLLTVGDQGIKCPSRSPGQHRGGPLGAPPLATVVAACHRIPQAARCPATCPWGKPRSDAWAGEQERSPEVAICRGKGACRGGCLPAPDSLPAIRPCRGAWGAAAGFSCGAWVRPSRQAPLAGVSVFCLVYFVLEWSCMGSAVPASSSCRGLASLARQAPLAGGLVLNARSSLGASWAGLAAGCYNCPCTSWGTKVPPALVHRQGVSGGPRGSMAAVSKDGRVISHWV